MNTMTQSKKTNRSRNRNTNITDIQVRSADGDWLPLGTLTAPASETIGIADSTIDHILAEARMRGLSLDAVIDSLRRAWKK